MAAIDNDIEKYLDIYKDSFNRKKKPRLPKQLNSMEDTYARLSALYILAVKSGNHDCRLDDNTTSRIQQVASWLHDSPKHGLILRGTLGNGKTTMLKAVSTMLEYGVVRVNAKAVYDAFKKTEMPEYFSGTLLFLDDLGAEPERCNIYGVDYHPLSDIILYRYDNNLTTVIATNLSFDEIRSRYGDRVYDRLIEMYDAIEYDAPSYRGIV